MSTQLFSNLKLDIDKYAKYVQNNIYELNSLYSLLTNIAKLSVFYVDKRTFSDKYRVIFEGCIQLPLEYGITHAGSIRHVTHISIDGKWVMLYDDETVATQLDMSIYNAWLCPYSMLKSAKATDRFEYILSIDSEYCYLVDEHNRDHIISLIQKMIYDNTRISY